MKNIIVLFMLVIAIFGVTAANGQVYEDNSEARAPFASVMDEDFFLEKEDADSTLIILNAVATNQDTVFTKAHYTMGYNFIMPIIVAAETDSTALKLVVQSGVYNKYTAANVWTDVDSLTVTGATQAVNPPQSISIPGGKIFRISVRTVDGNAWSQATILRLWYRRYR